MWKNKIKECEFSHERRDKKAFDLPYSHICKWLHSSMSECPIIWWWSPQPFCCKWPRGKSRDKNWLARKTCDLSTCEGGFLLAHDEMEHGWSQFEKTHMVYVYVLVTIYWLSRTECSRGVGWGVLEFWRQTVGKWDVSINYTTLWLITDDWYPRQILSLWIGISAKINTVLKVRLQIFNDIQDQLL